MSGILGRVDIFLIASRGRRRIVEKIRKATTKNESIEKSVRWSKLNKRVTRSRLPQYATVRRVSTGPAYREEAEPLYVYDIKRKNLTERPQRNF